MRKKYRTVCTDVYCAYLDNLYRYSSVTLFLLGMVMLTAGLDGVVSAEENDPKGIITAQLCKILGLLVGPFGALITVVAGLGAVVAAAMGGYKLAPERNIPSLRCAPFRLL